MWNWFSKNQFINTVVEKAKVKEKQIQFNFEIKRFSSNFLYN